MAQWILVLLTLSCGGKGQGGGAEYTCEGECTYRIDMQLPETLADCLFVATRRANESWDEASGRYILEHTVCVGDTGEPGLAEVAGQNLLPENLISILPDYEFRLGAEHCSPVVTVTGESCQP